VLKYSVIIAR